MRYRDLIQFDPIDTVIQLREADDREEAAHLVGTYVISDRMADQLTNLVIPNLQIDRPADNKGVLIVGNYGTGKSHLMAVISAIAEFPDLAANMRNPAVQEAAGAIAGRFQVWRTEIGGVEKGLREIILDELEECLAEAGAPYTFPPADQVTNNKDALLEAMEGFRRQHPDQGLLLVVDELLDYLRSREQRALILDLGFLRELGEIVELTPFRFIAGVQETLFDNPRFGFVADQLRRVRDRFEQVRIAREDIAFVVSRRLLKKNDAQIAQVTDHLRQFVNLYPHMADRLDEYARLFPIHPAYIDVFEEMYIAEKREVLKTFSQAIQGLLDEEVPGEQSGLISFDAYWDTLRDNPSLRTLSGVAEVVEKSNVLEGRVRNAYTKPNLREMALRIIHGLSVHRLTTSDIFTPLGMTAEELRDSLCLWAPLPEPDADFLAGMVQVALKEIMRTVSGQYISYNETNGQYYLDLKKDIDFDAKIEERGDFMERSDLNRYFYDALRPLLGLPTGVYVTGYNIWFYEISWIGRRVTRPGYLFFGHPNERSTAQPPRDFYVYILPPFEARPPADGNGDDPQPDEVILAFQGLDDEFEQIVRRYAGARAMADESPSHRGAYADKADLYLRDLNRWLRQNFSARMRISYRGVTRTVPEVLAMTASSASQDPGDLIQLMASHLLSPHFEDVYPDYPTFDQLPRDISEEARAVSAMDAVHFIARGQRTNLAVGVLDGLKLLDDQERIKPLASPYARYFLEKLGEKGPNQVVNRGEVLVQVAASVKGNIYKDPRFSLEPEWVAVTLLALVYDGQIVLSLGGRETLDAGSIQRAATLSMDQLIDFRHYGRPKELPLPVWTSIFEGLGLQTSLIRNESQRDEGVRALQATVQAELKKVVAVQHQVRQGLRLWGESLFTDRMQITTKDGMILSHTKPSQVSLSRTDLELPLREDKKFLETLSRFNTPGKLRNLTLNALEVQNALQYRQAVRRIEHLLEVIAQLQPLTAYLETAQTVLDEEHSWMVKADAARSELLDELRRLARDEGDLDLLAWQRRLDSLQKAYVQVYAELHRRFVLGPAGDERSQRIQRSERVKQLKTLSGIIILNQGEFDAWVQAITGILTCREFHEGLLEDSPVCPHCKFHPRSDAGTLAAEERLDVLDQRLNAMLEQWQSALRNALASETAQESIAHMTPHERKPLDVYLVQDAPQAAALPDGLAAAANKALQGIDTISIRMDELVEALKQGGLPCTAKELGERFVAHVQRRMRGHDVNNTRITIEE